MKDKWVVLNQISDEISLLSKNTFKALKEQNFFQKIITFGLLIILILGLITKSDSLIDIGTIILYTVILLTGMAIYGRIMKGKIKGVLIADILGWIVIYIYGNAVSRRMLISCTMVIVGLYAIMKVITLIKPKISVKEIRGKRFLANILGVILLISFIKTFNLDFNGLNKPEHVARNYFIKQNIARKNIHVIESRNSYENKGIDVILDIGDLNDLKGREFTDSTGKELPYILKEYVLWYNDGRIQEVTILDKRPILEEKIIRKNIKNK